MVILVKFTPDGRAWEASSEQADDEKSTRVYSGMALDTPQYWERNHYILTMTMLDTFEAADPLRGDSPAEGYARRNPRGDKPNKMATTIYRNMRSGAYMPDDTIYGTVYITNETANEIVDFTIQDFMYMHNQIVKSIITN